MESPMMLRGPSLGLQFHAVWQGRRGPPPPAKDARPYSRQDARHTRSLPPGGAAKRALNFRYTFFPWNTHVLVRHL